MPAEESNQLLQHNGLMHIRKQGGTIAEVDAILLFPFLLPIVLLGKPLVAFPRSKPIPAF